ncbi:MAG: hypothetical protein AUK01_05580 [Anaerolineae bacterium CG2_30_57_67]|nr:MAG: hypothetical protein AUK01_05580 [Anaerolineae bacterium CG2_30_57_67]
MFFLYFLFLLLFLIQLFLTFLMFVVYFDQGDTSFIVKTYLVNSFRSLYIQPANFHLYFTNSPAAITFKLRQN